MMAGQDLIFDSLGINIAERREIKLDEKWVCYNLNHNNPTKEVPIILIERGPKNITEIKRRTSGFDACVILFSEKNTLYLKSLDKNHVAVLDSDQEYERISSVISSHGMADATNQVGVLRAIQRIIESIPSTSGDFDNRGLFSTHYLRNRLFGDSRTDLDMYMARIRPLVGGDLDEILATLGWDKSADSYYGGRVSVTVTSQDDFGIRASSTDVVPSYAAVATLRDSQWAILTNGRRWRLYSSKISASSTNYFELTLNADRENTLRYLVAIFGAGAFEEINERTDIDMFLEESAGRGRGLENDLSNRIMQPDGLFINLVKGVLDHSLKRTYTVEDLEDAKQTSLKIMYRVWFLAYAESRNLLPVHDDRYKPISLRTIRTGLDSYEGGSGSGTGCWDALRKLFGGVRNGSVEHNLPQYDGGLFRHTPSIDEIQIKNKFIVNALRDLLEKDGAAIDYADLGVRHLGNIFETLMEFSVKQAGKDLMLIEDKDGIREVKTKQESTYSYKKNDLYLASKAGIAARKMSASFYTPDKIVKFLVNKGLEPIFAEREKLIGGDLKRYKKDKNNKNLKTCMDRLLDIQVLDPAMGSGHFLVEALNKITTWATNMLKKHPDHPLLAEIELDRNMVLSEQREKDITIEEDLLTHDVLLKRRVMKRCIFGVDLNPMAVELAKLSLWLDSFAIGVPLTYMDHHIKNGDSTIGMFLCDLKNEKTQSLDDWMHGTKSNKLICDIVNSSDITIKQVNESREGYEKYIESLEPIRRILDALTASKMDPSILPKREEIAFIHKFGQYSKNEPKDFTKKRNRVNQLTKKYLFFHWEMEMLDAFMDNRKGFDVIIGNPPWDKVKPNHDEFFISYCPTFKSLKPNTLKKKKIDELTKDKFIKCIYDNYKQIFVDKSLFYKTYELQGKGDRDLWQLMLERSLQLITENGIISMVTPSQLLSNNGATDMRKNILEKDILSLYVFENKEKIFPIDSRYKFALLSIRDSNKLGNFPAGFYLHSLSTLEGDNSENTKLLTLSKNDILKTSAKDYAIPETDANGFVILLKISKNHALESGIGDGWSMRISRGFHTGNDADLLKKDGKGWHALGGKNIHQFIHEYNRLYA